MLFATLVVALAACASVQAKHHHVVGKASTTTVSPYAGLYYTVFIQSYPTGNT